MHFSPVHPYISSILHFPLRFKSSLMIQNWTPVGSLFLNFLVRDRAGWDGMISGLWGIHDNTPVDLSHQRLWRSTPAFSGSSFTHLEDDRPANSQPTVTLSQKTIKHTSKHTSSSSLLYGDTNNLGFLHRRSLPFSPRPPEPDAFQAYARLWDVVCSLCQMTTQSALS